MRTAEDDWALTKRMRPTPLLLAGAIRAMPDSQVVLAEVWYTYRGVSEVMEVRSPALPASWN